MKIIFLGHGGFRFEIGKEVLLVDPFLTGNPVFPAERYEEAIEGVTAIFVTHGHGDHTSDAYQIAKAKGVKLYCIADLAGYWGKAGEIDCVGFNKGGTIRLDGVAVTMVMATHSSSLPTENGPVYVGTESGFILEGEGHSIYFSGDTDVMADMKIFHDLHKPDIGILCAGGHYTMDMKRAAYAAKTFFEFKTVIPMHYKTFPGLEQSAEVLVAELPGVDVIEPEVLTALEF
ncbi:metal-dependent hydrolase [Pseudooceanicola sp. CBS1P-1]|uniref:UPF0173 metal-dependent hydrolase GR170_10890 n=1 Tax=Pseudooceanicola albus TaxID=2692189 RepID=A0A6L7G1V3_9RHOB|nr:MULTISPECIES: metal-dependent hydrolase [Pseudooceanicola]MBT9384643.1 metal-dependent hydrolase [Pseudooceanicola endophyticus]MXN18344.1 metal-dependent hydrolase [Pseudooceanicola albus]